MTSPAAPVTRPPSRRTEADRDLCALAANVRVVLVGPNLGHGPVWEETGFFRWERRQRAYYTETRLGIVNRLSPKDEPHFWRPLGPLQRFPAAPRQAVNDGGPENLDAALTAFRARVLTALRVDQALRHRELDQMKVRAYPLQTVPGPGDYGPEQITRFRPSRADIDDYEVVMPAFAKLTGAQQDLLWLVSFGFSLRSIAERKKTNATKARRWIADAVIACWRAHTAAVPVTSAAGGRVQNGRREAAGGSSARA